MPSARQTKSAGLALSLFVLAAAGALALRQRQERVGREADLSAADTAHFRGQDRRRSAGALLMSVLAVALAVGCQLPYRVGQHSNRFFLIVWLAVFVLILLLLALAFFDLAATRVYARRQRQALLREHLGSLRSAAERRQPEGPRWNDASPPGNGFPH